MRRRACRRALQHSIEAHALLEAALQAATPDWREIDRVEEGRDETRIARGDPLDPGADPLHGLERERQDLGIRGRDVGAAEALEPGLDELAGAFRPHAEHRPAVGEGCGSAGLRRGQIGACRRDRIFRPEAELAAGAVRREVETRPDVLTAEVEEGRCFLQQWWLDPVVPGLA